MIKRILKSIKDWRRRAWRRWRTSGFLTLDWWVSLIPYWLTVSFFRSLITYPFRLFAAAWYERRIRNFLWGLPAVLVFFCVVGLTIRLRQQASGIPYRYWEESQYAYSEKKYAKAEVMLDRILSEGKANVNDAKFLLAAIYDESGYRDRAEAIFRSLAPDDRQGFPKAHRRLALILSDGINLQTTKEALQGFRWHLDHANDDKSPEMALAWGRYSIAARDLPAAGKYFRLAASAYPEIWLTIGEVDTAQGRNDDAVRSYGNARQYLARAVGASPSDQRLRSQYATVLMRLGQFNESRLVLEDGLKLEPDGPWNGMIAALYVNMHDLLAVKGNVTISELLDPISKALEYDPNSPAALNRLMSYARAKVTGTAPLRTLLTRVVAEGKQPALSHLALGNLCWLEGDNKAAMFHFERAISINKKLCVVMNNLAWIIAHDETSPDFDRALALVNAALEERPNDPSFLDTRGTIYMLKGNFKEALDDLEISLRNIREPAVVHHKLAEIYDKLDRSELAEQHRKLENDLNERGTSVRSLRNQPRN